MIDLSHSNLYERTETNLFVALSYPIFYIGTWYVMFSVHYVLCALCSLCILQFKLTVLFFRSSRHVSCLPCFISFIHVVRGGTGRTRWSDSRLDRARQQRERETWHVLKLKLCWHSKKLTFETIDISIYLSKDRVYIDRKTCRKPFSL